MLVTADNYSVVDKRTPVYIEVYFNSFCGAAMACDDIARGTQEARVKVRGVVTASRYAIVTTPRTPRANFATGSMS
jgi:hypothetical protein